MKFKSMSLKIVSRSEYSKIKEGLLEVTFENRVDRGTFVAQMNNFEVNGVLDEELDAYSDRDTNNEFKACINLPLENGNFKQAEKDAVLARIQKVFPEAYDYTKDFTKSPSRGISILPKALKDYFAHLYRAPSRHPRFMSVATASLVGLGLFYFSSVGLFTAVAAGLLSGVATTVGINLRKKYYGRYQRSRDATNNLSDTVFAHGQRAGESWKPYLTSFVNYKDYLHLRSFGKGMVVRMNQLDKAERTDEKRSSYRN